MIKAFLFDWGGVMSTGGRGDEFEQVLEQSLGLDRAMAQQLLDTTWAALKRGELTEVDFWRESETLLGRPIPAEQRAIWYGWRQVGADPTMVDLVKQLKTAGYPVGLISNIIAPTANDIRAHSGYDVFDFCILSYEVGYAKPDPEIYQLALQKLPDIHPGDVLFIDDQPKCVKAAAVLGMQTILATSPTQVIADVTRLVL